MNIAPAKKKKKNGDVEQNMNGLLYREPNTKYITLYK